MIFLVSSSSTTSPCVYPFWGCKTKQNKVVGNSESRIARCRESKPGQEYGWCFQWLARPLSLGSLRNEGGGGFCSGLTLRSELDRSIGFYISALRSPNRTTATETETATATETETATTSTVLLEFQRKPQMKFNEIQSHRHRRTFVGGLPSINSMLKSQELHRELLTDR